MKKISKACFLASSKVKSFISRSIPSIITGAADNDPAGISTYSIAGAQFGYQLNWLIIFATPMLIAVEAMCARLSDVKKKGLARIFRDHYPKPIIFLSSLILVVVNTITIGADLAGMAASASLIVDVRQIVFVPIVTLVIWAIIFFGNFQIIQKYLIFMVLFFLSYIIAGFLAKPDWFLVIRDTLLPTIIPNINFFAISLAILGTTMAPYLFFWQSGEEVESRDRPKLLLAKAREEDRIVAPGFIASNIISLFIMITTGTVLFAHGITDIESAAQAAAALVPLAGEEAKLIFAIGLLGAGFLAVPVIVTTTAYVVADTFGWRDSLSDKLSRAKGFYAVIILSLVVGVIIPILNVNPIKALFYSQVLAGFLTPFLLVMILILCNSKKVMGEFTNGWFDNLFGWLAVIAMLLSTAGILWQLLS